MRTRRRRAQAAPPSGAALSETMIERLSDLLAAALVADYRARRALTVAASPLHAPAQRC